MGPGVRAVLMSDTAFTLGLHEGKIDMLVTDVAGIKNDVADIKRILSEHKGERRVALWFAGVAGGAFGTAITGLIHWFKK